jgi:hypothetical protein
MSEVSIKIEFKHHPCTNHTTYDFHIPDSDCSECGCCNCDAEGYCCGLERSGTYCSDCGDEIERPYCYSCAGEEHEGCGERIESEADVLYSGTVTAVWKHGELIQYRGYGHPHLQNSYCLGEAAPLFEDVTTEAQAIEAVVTHISNVDFGDGLGSASDYYGIEVA